MLLHFCHFHCLLLQWHCAPQSDTCNLGRTFLLPTLISSESPPMWMSSMDSRRPPSAPSSQDQDHRGGQKQHKASILNKRSTDRISATLAPVYTATTTTPIRFARRNLTFTTSPRLGPPSIAFDTRRAQYVKISFQLLNADDYYTHTESTCDSNCEILLPSGFPLFDLFSCISDHNGTPRVGAGQGQLHATTTDLQYYCTSTHYSNTCTFFDTVACYPEPYAIRPFSHPYLSIPTLRGTLQHPSTSFSS